MIVRLADGYGLFVAEAGEGLPVVLLHGGPGLDHQSFRPWLDPLADEFRLLFVDQRGQGRSEPAEPELLSLAGFARDVELLREALGLERFALVGHSFGAAIATFHAIEHGTAAGYVLSGGSESSAGLARDVGGALAALGDDGAAIAAAWRRAAEDDGGDAAFRELVRAQARLQFTGDPPPDWAEGTILAPAVMRRFARPDAGAFDFRPRLGSIRRPVLVVTGEHDRIGTPRAAAVLHDSIPHSTLVLIRAAGHVAYVEAQAPWVATVRDFLRRLAV